MDNPVVLSTLARMSTYSSWRSDQGNMRALSDELEAQAAMARSREAALSRRLHSLEGDLSSRVEVLSRLVNALIELGEVREELALFTPARRARDAARALTRAVVFGEGDVSHLRRAPDLVDVHDYWLVPAALAVADARDGRLDAEAAQEALVRDRRRAATYLVAVCALVGHPGLAAPWLASALEAPEVPDVGWGSADGGAPAPGDAAAEATVTVAGRALWLAAADGALGAEAADAVRAGLAGRVALLADDARSRLRTDLLAQAPALGAVDGWGSPTGARDDLGTLRAWVAWSRDTADGDLAVTSAGTEAAGGPAGDGAAETSTGGAGADDEASSSLADLVSSLVDEGAPVERDLLDRAEALSERVGRAPDDERRWSAPAGRVVDLLVEDARGADARRAVFVAPLLAADLRAVGHDLVARTEAAPAPSAVLRLGGRTVTVTPSEDGAAAASAARSELLARPVDGVSWPVVGGAGAVAVVALVLAVVVSPAWWVVTAGAAVVAGWQWFAGSRRATDQAAHAQDQAERFDAEVVRARADVAEQAEQARARREAVAEAAAALDEALDAPRPAAPEPRPTAARPA